MFTNYTCTYISTSFQCSSHVCLGFFFASENFQKSKNPNGVKYTRIACVSMIWQRTHRHQGFRPFKSYANISNGRPKKNSTFSGNERLVCVIRTENKFNKIRLNSANANIRIIFAILQHI